MSEFDPKAWHKMNRRDPEERWGAAVLIALVIIGILCMLATK